VGVHVFVVAPLLEHAPDQIASRPFETVSVTAVPVANEAEPLLPVATLIPAGLDVTRSPLRPVAVTVSVAVCGGGGAGLTVSVAVAVPPLYAAEIVTAVDVVTAAVETANVAVLAPDGTVTLAGTLAAALLLASETVAPACGAAPVSVTVPCAPEPPVTLAGLTDTLCSAAAGAGGAGGVTVSVAVRVEPLYEAVMTIDTLAETGEVVTVKSPVKPVDGTVVVAGTVATAGLLLESDTTAPLAGAGVLRTTVPKEASPPTTVDGLMFIVDSVAAGGGAWGVKLRTADQGPAVPAEFTPRTRQKCVAVERSVVGYIDDVTVASRSSGAANVLESSIWISYEAAPATSLQSKVIGCGGVSAFAGASSAGAAGTGGGAGGVDPVALSRIFVTNASPQKIEGSPLKTVSSAPVVAGKSNEKV
jgi:hypothetical protein